ncbi:MULTISPECIES: hypothetical protein [unclassified Methylobacterium]|uniref:hypothetical protein n=1 Tax=unclassified Methylobacterium TaxID=2615210 RepID=UPI0011C1E88A|nr:MULTISPECIES: hypothetical protein [unclassified Methylobacterium]QEE39359.1 hypothetical protein FVA80_10800 [Methylobacterium sp. WL1]TXN58253.1 hypothetical protein FV241_07770 [Methylobacterium sp. WL2]
MTGRPESLNLVDPRRIDHAVDRRGDAARAWKGRMAAVENNSAGVHRPIDRIERRLDLADAPH